MILSTQTHFLADHVGHDEAIKILAKAGFDALDLSMFSMHKEGDIFYGNDAIENVPT